MQNEKEKIREYKSRRDARLAKRGLSGRGGSRVDSVDSFYERRNQRRAEKELPEITRKNKRVTIDKRDNVWYNNSGREERMDSNTRLAFGLCEKNGIHLPKGASPKDAWDALAGKGITPQNAYESLGAKKSGEGKKGYSTKKDTSARSKLISGDFAKKHGIKKEASTFSQSIKEALDHGMSEEKISSVLSNLKPEDIYEINGESGVIGLASKIDDAVVGKSDECQAIWNKAKENGTPITNDVIEITKSLGATMSGLEFAVKAGKSSSEKIDREHADYKKDHDGEEDPRTDEEVLSSLNDVVRFTQFSPHDKLAENASKTISALKNKGYEIVLCKNRYASPKPQEYYDIKIVARNQQGQDFELQFHSKESLEVKNKNHGLYEKQRAVGVSEAEKERLGKEMAANAAKLSKPKGYDKIPDFDNRK